MTDDILVLVHPSDDREERLIVALGGVFDEATQTWELSQENGLRFRALAVSGAEVINGKIDERFRQNMEKLLKSLEETDEEAGNGKPP